LRSRPGPDEHLIKLGPTGKKGCQPISSVNHPSKREKEVSREKNSNKRKMGTTDPDSAQIIEITKTGVAVGLVRKEHGRGMKRGKFS